VLTLGPSVVVAKQGEHGAALVSADDWFAVPAYPVAHVVDPTGAGDTFAGGFVGYLARHTGGPLTAEVLRTAMAYGTALASFNVEEFGTGRVQRVTLAEVAERVEELRRATCFEHVGYAHDAHPVEVAPS